MLILSRRKDERILIGDDIKITVIKVGGGKVHLGIDAPVNVTILREEVANRDKAEPEDVNLKT